MATNTQTANGVKLLGEILVPGASHMIDGNMRTGGLHLAGALGALAVLGGGGLGLLAGMLIRGNSFTTSTVHKPLHRAVIDRDAAATS